MWISEIYRLFSKCFPFDTWNTPIWSFIENGSSVSIFYGFIEPYDLKSSNQSLCVTQYHILNSLFSKEKFWVDSFNDLLFNITPFIPIVHASTIICFRGFSLLTSRLRACSYYPTIKWKLSSYKNLVFLKDNDDELRINNFARIVRSKLNWDYLKTNDSLLGQ